MAQRPVGAPNLRPVVRRKEDHRLACHSFLVERFEQSADLVMEKGDVGVVLILVRTHPGLTEKRECHGQGI
jgi:hypothetical protein